MSALRIVQVSDTHLSRLRAYFQTNWEAFVEIMAEEKPNLIVHSGDLCLRGNLDADDMPFGREQLDRLTSPVRIIPGNHDIGDTPPDERRGHPVSADNRARWRALFGPDWWKYETGAWMLLGINAQIFDSGMPAEANQWTWLEDTLSRAGDRQILVFSHKNLFIDRPDETGNDASALYPASRHRLIELFARNNVRAVACGHNHCYRTRQLGGMELIWAPSTSFVNRLPKAAGIEDGIRRCGYLRFTLDGNHLRHAFVEPPLFFTYDVTNWARVQGTTVKLPERPLHGMGGYWDAER